MKLYELDITPVRKSIFIDDPYRMDNVLSKANDNNQFRTKTNNPLTVKGSGYFAAAFTHNKKPGVIVKIGRFDERPQDDGYLTYVQSILKNDRITSNPYFPRIYSVKVYRNAANKYEGGRYVIEMEQLHPLNKATPETITAFGEKMFNYWPSHGNMINIMQNLRLASHRDRDAISNIKDKKLLQAIAIISNIQIKNQNGLDIKDSNCMVRYTSTGPQFVITDPLA